MDKFREAFEDWFRTTKAYQMLEEQNYFKMDLFHFVDGRNEYRHTSVQIAFMTWQSRQSEFDAMTDALLNQTQLLAKQKVEIEEKDKRVETLITTWRNQAKELCNVDDKHVREALLSCADELEVMRANNANS